jgi:pimeloyl-ACP methyl ester carboxylesterase
MAVARLATHEWPPSGRDSSGAEVAVLVHGIAGWHRTWWRVGPALAERGWRVVAVDQRGHGRSARIDGFVTIADFAGDLAAAIEDIGAPVDALIGHSLGASVSIEMAHRRPELVRRLVLEDPPTMTRAGDVAWLENFDRELQAAHADPGGEVARELAANPSWLEEDARQDIDGKQLADRVGLLATFGRDTGARVPELLPQLTVPALVILAAEDRSVCRGEPRRRLEREPPPGGRVAVVDAGHTIHRDRFDDYLTATLDWIEAAA